MPEHVVVGELDGHPTIAIDDWELFDFIEDHLTDHDLEYDHFTEEEAGGIRQFVMHFLGNVNFVRLNEVMDLIDPEEVERIWKINN